MTTEDIVAIQQLVVLYDHFFDQIGSANRAIGRPIDAAEIMTEDCEFFYQGTRIQGREAYEQLHVYPEGYVASHATTNIHVYEEDGETRAHGKFIAPDPETGGIHTGDIYFVLVRTADGWRIRKKTSMSRHPASRRLGPSPFGA